MLCSEPPRETGSPTPSTPPPIVTATTSATTSLWAASSPRLCTTTSCWSATSPALSTNISLAIQSSESASSCWAKLYICCYLFVNLWQIICRGKWSFISFLNILIVKDWMKFNEYFTCKCHWCMIFVQCVFNMWLPFSSRFSIMRYTIHV